MTSRHLLTFCTLVAFAIAGGVANAKDKPVSLAECPAAVQEVIKKYQAQGKLEEIGRDDKKKSGGPAVYEAKFQLDSGRRVEVHISTAGEVLEIQEKKRKTE